jgi:hypothetical protein
MPMQPLSVRLLQSVGVLNNMGSSGSFKGSGGKDAGSLRDAIAEWLEDESSSAPSGEATPQDSPDSADSTNAPVTHLSPDAIMPAIRLWSSGSGGGGGGGGSSRASGSRKSSSEGDSGKGRGSGSVHRTVSSVAGPAGRASSLVQSLAAGNRQAIESAGLNFDELSRLNDPLEVGKRITDVAFDTQPDGTIEDYEARIIVAELVSWMMETPEQQQPTPSDVVKRTIELMIARATLTEVGDSIRAREKDQNRRRETENEIRLAARVNASKVNISSVGATPADISKAIEENVKQLVDIYGEKK